MHNPARTPTLNRKVATVRLQRATERLQYWAARVNDARQNRGPFTFAEAMTQFNRADQTVRDLALISMRLNAGNN